MADSFSDNAARGRFELEVGGQVAFANYKRTKDALAILHVETPAALRGTGVASRLMENIVATAKTEGIGVVPYCSYAADWMRRRNGASR